MTSGILKWSIGASLAVHAAGFGVIAYFQFPRQPEVAPPMDAPFVMTVVAAPDESVNSETISLSPPPAQPVEPVATPKPEPDLTPPPEPQPNPESPKPVVLQPEPPVMLMPDLFANPPAAVTVTQLQPAAAVASPTTSDVKAVTSERAATAPRGERVVTRAQADYRKNTERFYPAAAIRRHEEGLVIVRAEVDTLGFPRNVELKESSGHPLLDAAAIRAVKSWEFEPARMDGRPVVSTVEVPVNFKLSDVRAN